MLTQAEAVVLKADVHGFFASEVAVQDWPAISNAYNLASNPPAMLWRPDVTPTEIASAIVMSEFVALTAIKQNGLLLLTQGAAIDATQSNVRAAFQAIFGAGATMTALTALAQRVGTRFEVLFSSAVAGARVTTKYGQPLTADDVQSAMLT
jgi:hypothetical protein